MGALAHFLAGSAVLKRFFTFPRAGQRFLEFRKYELLLTVCISDSGMNYICNDAPLAGSPNGQFIRVADLTDDDREFFLKTWRTHDRHSVRCRAHAILLSAQEVSVPQLTMIFNIDDDTARSWLSRWEERGREGLEDAPRPGGPFKVDDAGRKLAIDLLHEHPTLLTGTQSN